jgi:DNA-directed RNA polymerase specialized sigma24 family protein
LTVSRQRSTLDRVAFPLTHGSLIERTQSGDPEVRARAHETLAAVYWGPVYAYVRLTHGAEREDAEDLTQGFFADALRRDLFARYAPGRARFRTYLRTCVDAYVANERKAQRRLKRGGGTRTVRIDLADLEGRLRTESDVDAVFYNEWVRGLFALAVSRLRERFEESGRRQQLAVFERYDLADPGHESRPTYAQIAADLGVPTTQVTNWLAAVRREFRAIVVDTLRETCGNDQEFRTEARALLGIDVA